MPRRELLTAAQREALLAFPEEEENLLRYYVLSVRDVAAVRQHRGNHNRLGFAVQLCYLRYPGRVLAENETPPAACFWASRPSLKTMVSVAIREPEPLVR
jgi:TnpA family transposase